MISKNHGNNNFKAGTDNRGNTLHTSYQPGEPEESQTIRTKLAAYATHLTQTTIAIFNFMFVHSSDLTII